MTPFDAPEPTRPEPVVAAGKAASVVTGLITLAATVSIISASEAAALTGVVAGVVAAVGTLLAAAAPLIAAYQARRHVTPVADPVDQLGRPLVPQQM